MAEPSIGHNSAAAKDEQTAHNFAKDQLKSIVERIERLEEEKKAITEDIRDFYAEAKGNGFDVKSLRAATKGYLRQLLFAGHGIQRTAPTSDDR